MITGKLRSEIDKLWEHFWTGGITNPLTVIEQISFLMFARLLDVTETRNEKRAQHTKKDFKHLFTPEQQHLRWKSFKELSGDKMLKLVRDEVFPHFKEIAAATTVGGYMADATLMVQKPSLLQTAVDMIDALPLTQGDTKGDLYEHLLSKLSTAGINGQFRTPRHIIRFMVELLEPKTTDVVGDPACGTAGFLVGVMQYLMETHTNVWDEDDEGNKHATGDTLTAAEREHLQSEMFHGYDLDTTMLRVASMNLLLHGVEQPDIRYMDTLSNSFPDKMPERSSNAFDVILANPPFKGSLDADDVHVSLHSKLKTKKTELLFVGLILRMLKMGGRSATIVPDGVLFGSSKAHVALRKLLIDENQLEAMISLPAGVFRPYAGVSTAILVFTKGGETRDVFFYDVQGDGYSLDDKRELKPDTNDLPSAINAWRARDPKQDIDRAKQHFFVPVEAIRAEAYDLSINRYRQQSYDETRFEAPSVIHSRLMTVEREITKALEELGRML